MGREWVVACACALAWGCDGDASRVASDTGSTAVCAGKCDAVDGAAPVLPSFVVCESLPPPAAQASEKWRHFSSSFVTLGLPQHRVTDAIATPGEPLVLEAKLAYGPADKDLEDEWVEVFIDDCDEFVALPPVLTDGDGRVRVKVDPGLVSLGRHRVHLRVAGDGSMSTGTALVVPEDTRVAVFDIDGTLTESDWELFEDLIDDLFVPLLKGAAPRARDGARKATLARAEQGYVVVYLTGRPDWLTARSRDWLDERGMAPGLLHTAPRTVDALPSDAGVGAYKADFLADLQQAGLQIELAYGNATTDIFAYAEAAVPESQTFILGAHGGEDGTVALGEDFVDHLETLDRTPIEQPFAQ